MYDINLRNVKKGRGFFAIFFIFGIVFLAVPLFSIIEPFIERSKLSASTLSLPIKETNQEENYDNFINDINNMMNTYMSVNNQNKITTNLTTETKVGGYLMGGACLSPVFIAALYLTVSNKKMNDKER